MEGDLLRGRGLSLEGACHAFVMSALGVLRQWRRFVEVLKELPMDAFQYCTACEEDNVQQLAALGPFVVASLAIRTDDGKRAMSFTKPQPRIDFRELEKAYSSYWLNFVRNER